MEVQLGQGACHPAKRHLSPPLPAVHSGLLGGQEQPSVGTCQQPQGFSPDTSVVPVDKGLAGETRPCLLRWQSSPGEGANTSTQASVCGRTCWLSSQERGFEARGLVSAILDLSSPSLDLQGWV